MKLTRTAAFSPRCKHVKKHGFALIATLTLMMLLTLLAVGLLAMASSQNRIAMQTVLQTEARQQALIGLDAALGELQVELGPDQRVSASSGILASSDNSSSQHILGVWDSWDGPIYGKRASKGGSIQDTYESGRRSMFRRWLISARNPRDTRNIENMDSLSTSQPGRRVCMVGEGTLGRSLTARHYVYADLLYMPSSGKNKAAFAWWVAGENQKAKISVTDPVEDTDPVEVLHRTWNTPGPMFVQSENMDFLPAKIEEPAKLVTLPTLPLVASVSQSPGMPYFFDVTTSSYSLPINVSMGGLKQDLCLLLNKENLKGTEFAARSDQDCPIADNNDVPTGSESKMPIGSWQVLHAYYNCWPDGSASDGKNFTARLLGSVNSAYTRMSGSVFNEKLSYGDDPDNMSAGTSGKTYFDSRSMMEQGSRAAGYARTPVMLAFMNNFGLVTEPNEQKPATDDGVPLYRLSMCFAPMFLWWNPYNVPMKIRGQQMWSHSSPYKTSWIQSYAVNQAGTWNYSWSRYAMVQSTGLAGFGLDYGEYFQKDTGSKTADIEFEPGEILFFSPGKARVTDDYTKAFLNPWIEGYHPSSVAGYKALFYSMTGGSTSPGVASETNIEEKQFYVGLRLGMGAITSDPRYPAPGYGYPDGQYFSPDHSESITIANGFNGVDTESTSVLQTDTLLGKRAMSPQRFILGWYDPTSSSSTYEFCRPDSNQAYWTTDGSQSDNSVPYYIASLGITVKSANRTLDSHIFPDKDYRSKIWQHSSPAFWGSAITNPDDQQRAYHPYQLAALDVSAGLNAAPMDNIGNNGVLGITSDGEQVSYASVMELPVHPPFSLAGFAGMRLQPGWYKPSSSGQYATVGALRRMQYQAGVPGVGIGNSFADPCLPATDVYASHSTNMNSSTGSNGKLFSDFFDHALLINDALWDRWFCSSVSDMPINNGKRAAEDVLEKFLSGEEELPVARYKRTTTPYKDEDIIDRLMADDGWKYIAAYLMIDGGFNVNSVSEEAWAAVLQGLAKRNLVSNVKDSLSIVEKGKAEDEVLFSRFMVSTSDKAVDSLGGYSMKQGSSSLRSGKGMLSAWGEVRMLEPESIRKLAKEIVKQVRQRGPFLSMSDFINRRLETKNDNGLTGALQAAIDETDINREFKDVMITSVPGGSLYKYEEAAKGSMYTAAPGYLIQSDVLASLGNILTVRDDTFTIRAYGCVKNAGNAILAQAWCEAVVQRTIDYVDPSNKPEDSEYNPDGSKSNTRISDLNQVMGRRFRVVSFKWLDSWDI